MLKSHPTRVRGLKPVNAHAIILHSVSHPTRVRGLKLLTCLPILWQLVAPHTGAWIETIHAPTSSLPLTVAPHTGAWIETANAPLGIRLMRSHPTRVRGLKLYIDTETFSKEPSHPTRVRGLKPRSQSNTAPINVAPHTGAWIETCHPKMHPSHRRRTPHGCVD